MTESENLLDLYWAKLHTAKKAGSLIANFYWEALNLPRNKGDVIMFNKFVTMYGRELVFMAVTDIYNMHSEKEGEIDFSKPLYGLIKYFIEKRIEKKHGQNSLVNYIDLTDFNKRMQKKIDAARKKRGLDDNDE